ncbi:D-aspartate oxidase isoform X1 [Spodoptera frugiperda]|uniref:D-aspartate oxidase isoform X1 n=1 Tax=Spodoptera frugiperda TaxID=7108 RepID=A0A9R0DNW3_SPOFR|nr:D-aspartate oxidase isoform X1 [Spodoptera frugiperda]XP_035435139.2 D-aspartate oxidase isoform X1 [Spodoptera frugiperda]XP_050550617.1 D-aspartate oxidase isoform X1 [Spodoptera frugiperda]
MRDNPNIAVIGAGVIGTTVAKLFQDQLRNANITVIAEQYSADTTSDIAAGIFKPGTSFKGPTNEITKKWLNDSWQFWQDILKTPDAEKMGVMPLGCYIFSKENYHVTRNHLIEDLVPIYRPATKEELKMGPEGTKFGSYLSTLKVESERYLPWMGKIIVERGGQLKRGKVESFASLSNYDLVFNCAGLGAKYLCNDYDLVPIRGQVIKVKAPWVKYSFYGDYDTYIIPGLNGVVTLGGVRGYDSYNLNYCKYDAAAILERCCEFLPDLKNAEVVAHKVGLRPHRSPVRVEPELIDGLKVVHCYGHGGNGVATAPGTAIDAVEMGLNFLRSNVRNKL